MYVQIYFSEWISVTEAKNASQKMFNVMANLDFLAQIQNNFLQSV